jgi:hypothetical protein
MRQAASPEWMNSWDFMKIAREVAARRPPAALFATADARGQDAHLAALEGAFPVSLSILSIW